MNSILSVFVEESVFGISWSPVVTCWVPAIVDCIPRW